MYLCSVNAILVVLDGVVHIAIMHPIFVTFTSFRSSYLLKKTHGYCDAPNAPFFALFPFIMG